MHRRQSLGKRDSRWDAPGVLQETALHRTSVEALCTRGNSITAVPIAAEGPALWCFAPETALPEKTSPPPPETCAKPNTRRNTTQCCERCQLSQEEVSLELEKWTLCSSKLDRLQPKVGPYPGSLITFLGGNHGATSQALIGRAGGLSASGLR